MKAEGGSRDLIQRTREFALRVIRLYGALPNTAVAQVMGKQLLRAGTSVGAHYREAQRARSTAEFVSKIDGGRQELEESMYWMELLRGSGHPHADLEPLYQEAGELMAILTTCARNANAREVRQ